MNKLWIIIKREYLARVTKRSFILTTILTPVAFGLFFVLVSLIFAYQGNESKNIALIDEVQVLDTTQLSKQNLHFFAPGKSLDELKSATAKGEYDGVLVIPTVKDLASKKMTVYYYSDDQLSIDISSAIQDQISDGVRNYKITAMKLDKSQLESLNTDIDIDPEPVQSTEKNQSELTSVIAAAIGGAMGFVMYLTLVIYGMMIMRSVMEEKINRIVEVMISSVKPFQLMLGKIIGVGAVGITQLAIWAILIPLISVAVQLIFHVDTSHVQQMQQMQHGAPGMDMSTMDNAGKFAQVMSELKNQQWWLLVPLFILYFLGGFLLYSSLFAAVGSAIGDDLGESQALTIPITIPIVLAFYIMFVAVRTPESNLAVWSSIFPLFSPMVMPARLPFHPPAWQIILSVAVLIGTCLFIVWLSGRIYRVGILMYGKKVTLKELVKWTFYKG